MRTHKFEKAQRIHWVKSLKISDPGTRWAPEDPNCPICGEEGVLGVWKDTYGGGRYRMHAKCVREENENPKYSHEYPVKVTTWRNINNCSPRNWWWTPGTPEEEQVEANHREWYEGISGSSFGKTPIKMRSKVLYMTEERARAEGWSGEF